MKPEAKKVLPPPPEETEPTALRRTAPMWLIMLLAVLGYWGALYFDARGGGFHPQVYEPYRSIEEVAKLQPGAAEDEVFTKGRKVFQIYCMVCHQANGLGSPGQFPPLAGSEWVLAQSPNRIIRLVLNGGQGPMEVKGQIYGAAAMPPWKDLLKDEDIAAVLTYVRQHKDWGNSAPPVNPDQVKAIREKIKDRTEPFTAEELKGIPESE